MVTSSKDWRVAIVIKMSYPKSFPGNKIKTTMGRRERKEGGEGGASESAVLLSLSSSGAVHLGFGDRVYH